MAFEHRLTPPAAACLCRHKQATTVGLRGDEEIEIPVWLRLNTAAGCPEHDPEPPYPAEKCPTPNCRTRVVWAHDGTLGGLIPIELDPAHPGAPEERTRWLHWHTYPVGKGVRREPVAELTRTAGQRFGRTLHADHRKHCPQAMFWREQPREHRTDT